MFNFFKLYCAGEAFEIIVKIDLKNDLEIHERGMHSREDLEVTLILEKFVILYKGEVNRKQNNLLGVGGGDQFKI